ncbi:fas apoptotic inhibitory molecule 1 isoform X2 [Parus major]|uniref:fas apoptotic inhibitory molecule 1 isoform X2 n=1 Tax=Parus major TaxID=9157 RepID=UPI001443BE13|nr:fas apoptotic inhibitory molecule 1 isoform X2 [Parus major]
MAKAAGQERGRSSGRGAARAGAERAGRGARGGAARAPPFCGAGAEGRRPGGALLTSMASGEEITVCDDEVRSRYSHLEKMTDLVAVWEVALSDGVHKIEFEHGTTSGKRVVYVDGKEEIRREWMFKLVGKEIFTVGATKTKAAINIDAVGGFAYEYTLEINGKSLKQYIENRLKTTNTWILNLGGTDYRIVLGQNEQP